MAEDGGGGPGLALPTPPGYTRLVPLDRDRHRGLGVDEGARARFARSLAFIYLTAPEFFLAARHYPVAFARVSAPGGEGGELLPIAVTSFTEGDNRFVDEAGRWEPGVYVPAYVRRYPLFSVAVRRDPEAREPDFLVCVDEPALVAGAPPLFDAAGEPTAAWAPLEQLVKDMEAARRQTRRLASAIDELDVLEPFEAHAFRGDGRPIRLRNLLRVNEEKLNAKPAGTVKALMQVGALSRIYAHLMSLDNFAFLLERTPGARSTP